MTHYHVWLRSGSIFRLVPRKFDDRSTARKWAVRRGAGRTDRLVLACEECPEPKRSKRRPPRLSVLARDVAAAVGAPVSKVREALKASMAREREARRLEREGLPPVTVEHDPAADDRLPLAGDDAPEAEDGDAPEAEDGDGPEPDEEEES